MSTDEEDNQVDPDNSNDTNDYTNSELDSAEISTKVEVSLQSVAGFSSNNTMKLRGNIDNKDVVILIDPGATHNFISLVLVSLFKLPTTATDTYGVTMGNGEST